MLKIFQKFSKKYNKLERFALSAIFFIISSNHAKRLPSSLPGHYNFLNGNKFYKVVVRKKKFFLEEISNINYIKNSFPNFAAAIPDYRYKKILFGLIIVRITEALIPIENDVEEYLNAVQFLTMLGGYSKKGSISIDDMTHLKKGLKITKNLMGNSVYHQLETKISTFFATTQFSIGLCHGDFHSKNFVKSTTGKNYLIDFDCLRKNSIQEFDAIYFIVQKIIDDTPGIWWHEAMRIFSSKLAENKKYQDFLRNFIPLEKINLLTLTYFLDRVAQDSKYSNRKSEIPKDQIIFTITHLWNNWIRES